MIGAVMREPMNQTGIAAAVAGTGPQPRFEEQDRASQIIARHFIRNGQSYHAMRVDFPARFFRCNDSVKEYIIHQSLEAVKYTGGGAIIAPNREEPGSGHDVCKEHGQDRNDGVLEDYF